MTIYQINETSMSISPIEWGTPYFQTLDESFRLTGSCDKKTTQEEMDIWVATEVWKFIGERISQRWYTPEAKAKLIELVRLKKIPYEATQNGANRMLVTVSSSYQQITELLELN